MQSTIIQVQEDMGDPTKWAAQSQEQQTSRYQVGAVLLILTVSTNAHKNLFFLPGPDSWVRTRGNVEVTSPLPERLLICSIISLKVALSRSMHSEGYNMICRNQRALFETGTCGQISCNA